MRVAMLHSSFRVAGGAERYLRDLAAGLTGAGHEVAVFALPSANSAPGDIALPARVSAGIADPASGAGKVLTHLGDVADPTSGRAMAAIGAFQPDVVHVHNWQTLGAPLISRVAQSWPAVHTVHDYAICDPNNTLANRGKAGWLDAALKLRSARLVKQFRQVTFLWPSQRTKDIVRQHVPAIEELPSRIIPLAIPVSGTAGPLPEPASAGKTFVFLGALTAHKGLELLLEAWAMTSPRPGRLLIAGDGALRSRVEELSKVDESVRYLGYLTGQEKAELWREAHWLIFPSQWAENFSISCVEALLAGRPIIASEQASPPMASPGSVLTFGTALELASVFMGTHKMSAAEYREFADSAAADGALLDWDAHVRNVIQAYTSVSGR
jgi:glycosyltransferase involved in cell wall biosynthesis